MKKKYILVNRAGHGGVLKILEQLKGSNIKVIIKMFSRKTRRDYFQMFWYENGVKRRTVLTEMPEISDSIVIRFGSRMAINGSNNIVYNQEKNLRLNSSKVSSRHALINAGISAPPFRTLENYVEGEVVIERPHKHYKGIGFNSITNLASLTREYKPSSHYYSLFIDKEREFRVHVGHGRVIRVLEKPPIEGQRYWNFNSDNPFVTKRRPEMQEFLPLLKESIKATGVLNMDFGAVDVMWKDGVAYITEVNSAPGLHTSQLSVVLYSKYFDYLFSSDIRIEHEEVLDKKKSGSVYWKNKNYLK